MTVTLNAHAKINLHLGIKPKIVAGKHLLSSIFAEITLHDSISFDFRRSADGDCSQNELLVDIVTEAADGLWFPAIATADNIITKTCRVFQAAWQREFACALPVSALRVTLVKRIPAQAGLGGGSADAAATIKALAWACELSLHEDSEFLLAVASEVGADIGFFLVGGCALMSGFGEKLVERLPLPDPPLALVLAKPRSGVQTAEAYRRFDLAPTHPASDKRLLDALRQRLSLPAIAKDEPLFANNMEAAAMAILPELADLTREIKTCDGVLAAQLCGSGSAVFGLCSDLECAKLAAKSLAAKGYWSSSASTLSTTQEPAN